jgi:hypothetical protein
VFDSVFQVSGFLGFGFVSLVSWSLVSGSSLLVPGAWILGCRFPSLVSCSLLTEYSFWFVAYWLLVSGVLASGLWPPGSRSLGSGSMIPGSMFLVFSLWSLVCISGFWFPGFRLLGSWVPMSCFLGFGFWFLGFRLLVSWVSASGLLGFGLLLPASWIAVSRFWHLVSRSQFSVLCAPGKQNPGT